MNNARRKLIEDVSQGLANMMSDLEAIRDDEQEAYDNMPESLQSSERGEAAEAAVSNLDEAINNFEEVMSSLQEAAS